MCLSSAQRGSSACVHHPPVLLSHSAPVWCVPLYVCTFRVASFGLLHLRGVAAREAGHARTSIEELQQARAQNGSAASLS